MLLGSHKNRLSNSLLSAIVILGTCVPACSTTDVVGSRKQELPTPPNVLEERTDASAEEIEALVNNAYEQLFFGDPSSEAVFRDLGDGTAYIIDTFHGDVRTDSNGYGMLASVHMNDQDTFDKLWSWAKKYMLHVSGPATGQLDWRCSTSGDNCDQTAATDSSSIIVTALFIAESKFPQKRVHQYKADALSLLEGMSQLEERNGGIIDGRGNCFDNAKQMPRRSSTDFRENVGVDYLMPAFYDLWAENQPSRAGYWQGMAAKSRELLQELPDKNIGLIPELVSFDGERVNGGEDYINFTSRTLLNLSLDHSWNQPGSWLPENNERLLDFFLSIGIEEYASAYTAAGIPTFNSDNTPGHRSLVALAAGTSRTSKYNPFLEVLLQEEIPTGGFRYYDGMLYLLSLIVLSGKMPAP